MQIAPWVWPSLFLVTLALSGALHVLAAVMGRRKSGEPPTQRPELIHEECNKAIRRSADDAFIASEGRKRAEQENATLTASLGRSNSEIEHWKKEVERVRLHYQEQVRIRDDGLASKGSRINELEEQLRVSQAATDHLQGQLSIPSGWLKLKKVRYIATDSGNPPGEMQGASNLPEKDLTEFFEEQFLTENGKLVIPPGLYRKLFGTHNDPLRGVPKLLEIEFIHAKTKFSVLLPENISVTLPFPYYKTEERTD